MTAGATTTAAARLTELPREGRPTAEVGEGEEGEEPRWREAWATVLQRFEEEAGDPPEAEGLQAWEFELLGRLHGALLPRALSAAGKRGPAACGGGGGPRGKRGRGAKAPGPPESLAEAEQQLRAVSARLWRVEKAEAALAAAAASERRGAILAAAAAYRAALALGTRRPAEARMRFAHLLRVAGGGAGGGVAACEAELRRALVEGGGALPRAAATGRPTSIGEEVRTTLGRLILLLCQEGREEEALPLFRLGAWRHRIAPCVLRYAPPGEEAAPAAALQDVPGVVLDSALPPSYIDHLRELLAPGAAFWQEHGYSEVGGSGEFGYFSYLHSLGGQPKTSLDVIIERVRAVALPHFPELAEATQAEWWAHCRPHPVGHQLHFDSDDEGVGGARHPICSAVVYVDAWEGFGGPTLLTDQRLSDDALAARGWLVHGRTGRLCVFDGAVLHGVVPGRGEAPREAPPTARRITWMVAFWRSIAERPFGPEGAAGSSRPVPPVEAPAKFGARTYTWHTKLALASSGLLLGAEQSAAVEPRAVAPMALPEVWAAVPQEGAKDEGSAGALPAYRDCFQW